MSRIFRLFVLCLVAFQTNSKTVQGQEIDLLKHKLAGSWFLEKTFRVEKNDTIKMGPLMVALSHPPFDGPMSLEIDTFQNFRFYRSTGGVPLTPRYGKIAVEKRLYHTAKELNYMLFIDGNEESQGKNSMQTTECLNGYLLNWDNEIMHLRTDDYTERIFRLMKSR